MNPEPSTGSRSKWWVCGLLLLALMLNYMDRQTLSLTIVPISKELGLDLKNKDGSTRTLTVEDMPMDFDTMAACGTMGGSGGVIVMDDSVAMVEALANLNAFYAHESCGQCTPCREGSLWMKKITTRMVHARARSEDAALLKSVADQIAGRTICAFGEACAWPTQSFIAKFGDEFKAYPETKQAPKADGALELV